MATSMTHGHWGETPTAKKRFLAYGRRGLAPMAITAKKRFLAYGRRGLAPMAIIALLVCVLGFVTTAYAGEPAFDGDTSVLTNENWMTGISGDRLLSDIVLPGSAGAGTSSVFTVGGTASGSGDSSRVIAQNASIATQLTSGVRLFELRLTAQDPDTGWSGSKDTLWVAEQAGANDSKTLYYAKDANNNAISFKRAINYMRSFLKRYPSETVVVALSEVDDAAKVFRQLRSELDDYQNYLYLGSTMPKLKDVRGKVVVCTTHPELLGENGGMAFPARGTTASANIGGVQFSPLTVTNRADAQGLSFADSVPLTGDAHTSHSNVVYAGIATSGESGPTPSAHASQVNSVLFGDGGRFATRGTLYGWVFAGLINESMAEQLWRANYPDGLEYWTVQFYPTPQDEPIETKVLSGASAYGPSVVSKPGKFLDGWTTEPNGGGTKYKEGEAIPVTHNDMQLWGSWSMTWESVAGWLSKQSGLVSEELTIESDLTATSYDTALYIPEGANVTLNLSGHTLDRGLITAGTGDTSGSVIQLGEGATLTLKGPGKITGGYTTGLGGGVLMSESSTLVLDGVTIEGNVASEGGAGVYVPAGSTPEENANLVVQGATKVADNNKNFNSWPNYPSNVFLDKDVTDKDITMTVGGELASGARIGVTTFSKPTSGNYVTFTQGLSGKGSATNFTSDDDACLVGQVQGEGVMTTGVVVRFNTMGGNTMEDQLVAEGTHVAKPKDPWKYDKRRMGVDDLNGELAFRGWYKDEGCTDPWVFDQDTVTTDMLADGLTLYAKWGVRYTFNSDGGSEPVSDDSAHPMQYDSALQRYYIDLDFGQTLATMPSSTKENKELGGWAYNTDHADQVGMIFDFNTPATTSLAFTARWRKPRGPQYTVWFSPHNRTSELPSITVYSGGKINESQAPTVVDPGNEGEGTITRLEGCELVGWYKDSNCTRPWDFNTDTVTADTVLHAKWQEREYKVKFLDTDGTTELADEQNVAYGDCAVRPDDPQANEGYRFAGWYDPRDRPGYPYLFTRPITDDLTLTAMWKRLSYTVSFDAEGGTLAPYTYSQKIDHGDKVARPNNPSREGYTFLRWYVTDPDVEYDFETTPVTDNFVLHAAWQKQCTITFDAAGGTMNEELIRTVAYGKPIGALPTPMKGSDQFCGWFYNGTLIDDPTTPVTSDMTLVAQWVTPDPTTFTVVFDSKGGSPVPSQTLEGGENAYVTKPQDPTYGLLTFQGWHAKGKTDLFDFSQAVSSNLIVNNVLTLEAVWLPETRTVSFDAGDAGPNATGVPPNQTMAYGKTVSEQPDPVWQGYVFKHWVRSGESQPYDFTTPVTEDFTLVAVWARLCTVTFDSAGGSDVQPQVIVEGDTAFEPSDLTHNDDYHTFVGWFEEDATEAFDFTTPITDDLTLYAHWNVSTYTVSFDSGEGGSEVASQTVEHGTYAAEPTKPTREGCEFLYWHTQGSDTAFNFATPVMSDLTLVAAWDEHPTYNVFFDSNGGSEVDAQSVEQGELVERPLDPTKDNMRFAGWYVGDESYDFSTPVTHDLILTAHWTSTSVTHTVSFDLNGGTSAAIPAQTIGDGETAARPQNDPTREGYEFVDWYRLLPDGLITPEELEADASLKEYVLVEDGAMLTPYDFATPVLGDVTLKAHWRAIVPTYTITFDTRGGSELSPVVRNRGERIGNVARPTREGYKFDGWKNENDGWFDPTFTPAYRDMTLYAQWVDLSLYGMHVDIDPNNGGAVTRQNVPFFDQVNKPDDPTREGHTLDGWFEVLSEGYISPERARELWGSVPDFENKIHFEYIDGKERVLKRYNFVMPVIHDLELRAQWNADVCAVTFMSGGEIIDEQEVAWGEHATSPQDPYRYGYTFDGWCKDEGCTEPFDLAKSSITGNLVLYAKFSEITHKVTFDSAGGSSVGTQTVKHGNLASKPADPVWEEHTFLGWFEKDASEPFDFQNALILDDVKLYAHWDSQGVSPGPDQQTHGVHTSIVNGAGAPVVSQREGSLNTVSQAMFAKEATQQDVYVTLASSALEQGELNEAEKSVVKAKLSDLGVQVGAWFDLSLAKQLGSNKADPEAVHTTDQPLKLRVAVPEDLRSGDAKRTFYLLRVHDGAVDVLASGTGNNLDMESDRFSTYMLAYADEGQATPGGTTTTTTTSTTSGTSGGTTSRKSSPTTGDSTSMSACLVLAALGLLLLACSRHTKKRA